MNRAIFLDTSYFLALVRKRDVLHEVAVKASSDYTGPFVTTDLVLVELANSLALLSYRASAVAVIEKIRADKKTTVIPFGPDGMKRAFDFYKGRRDKLLTL